MPARIDILLAIYQLHAARTPENTQWARHGSETGAAPSFLSHIAAVHIPYNPYNILRSRKEVNNAPPLFLPDPVPYEHTTE